jgi:uracil-DNA glycosylase
MSYTAELGQIIKQAKTLLQGEIDSGLELPISKVPAITRETLPLAPSAPVAETLNDLKTSIGDCRLCKLCTGRKNIVFGEGAEDVSIMFIGEGPGIDEDRDGRPFVGEAGQLLTRIIENGIGIKRDQVYITTVVKCRPPENRDPDKDEIEACIPFLKKQIEIIRPKVICTLGRIAVKELLKRDFKITMERGRWQTYGNIPLMPTYHPAYILRNPGNEKKLKGEVWQDIQKIMSLLGIENKKNG